MWKKDKIIKYASIFVVSIVFLSVFVIYNISSNNADKEVISLNEILHEENLDKSVEKPEIEIESENTIFVEIKGEVKNPDVYEVKDGSIVKDLIVLSGGLTDNGDVSNINQARKLESGECVVVLSKEDILLMDSQLNDSSSAHMVNEIKSKEQKDDLIDINEATKDELKKLNGVGDVLAESIISYREEIGGFKSVDDLLNVSRIGSKTLDKFRDKIKV